MNESSKSPDNSGKPQDIDGLRAELAELMDEFVPFAADLWPRLEDHKSRWELFSYGLPDGYDKLVASDVIETLTEALMALGVAHNGVSRAHLKAAEHDPGWS